MDGSYREQLTNAIRELLPGVFFRGFQWEEIQIGHRNG